jgi:hypothetical protein
VPFDGSLFRDLLVQTPTVALLLLILYLDRKDHRKTVSEMHEENARLQQSLIDHMNRKLDE